MSIPGGMTSEMPPSLAPMRRSREIIPAIGSAWETGVGVHQPPPPPPAMLTPPAQSHNHSHQVSQPLHHPLQPHPHVRLAPTPTVMHPLMHPAGPAFDASPAPIPISTAVANHPSPSAQQQPQLTATSKTTKPRAPKRKKEILANGNGAAEPIDTMRTFTPPQDLAPATSGAMGTPSLPTLPTGRSSNSNAARNARNAAARASRESAKHLQPDVEPLQPQGRAARGASSSVYAQQQPTSAFEEEPPQAYYNQPPTYNPIPVSNSSTAGGRAASERIASASAAAGASTGKKNDPIGIVDGMKYHVDFASLPTPVIFEYLERNKALPPFGTQYIKNPFDERARACDPRTLYSHPTIDEPLAPHPLMQHLPGTQAPGVNSTGPGIGGPAGSAGVGLGIGMPGGISSTGGPSTTGSSGGGWTPYGLGIGVGSAPPPARTPLAHETGRKRHRRYGRRVEGSDVEEEEGNGRGKYRITNTSVMAAVMEESRRTAAQEDETRRRNEGENGEDAADGNGEGNDDVTDLGATAPRRSSRKPGTNGTSLAAMHRQTRSSPSPTPSGSTDSASGSEDEDDVDPLHRNHHRRGGRRGYRPILPDLEMARTIFAARATRNWCDALAAGGGQTVQGPGVNPATAGQVMMGGTGGMQREGEVVAEFLYAIKVKNRALKIAHEPVQAMFQNML
ncbi:hypothetical protein QFC22_004155 [Naganishia vaughanmartiniae]|uniref:Uncharacterized protein n=1 Tax=Naganishia vaughanmartiniae TaxID=1424756 RepID=A0ACC2X496_9TREE|nr:hypothetical protein QFC22_004155 [Naganishia vaughanmartiniae]